MYNKLSILTNYINYGVRNLKSSLSVDTPKLMFKDLFATCYHPNAFHQLISPMLQKPGKADCSNPHAWRLVHLLSTMGKWIEKIVMTRLLYYTTEHGLIPPNQFSAMPGRLTIDAVLCLAHNIQAANNHNLYTSLVTFDITGYFDNVNHN